MVFSSSIKLDLVIATAEFGSVLASLLGSLVRLKMFLIVSERSIFMVLTMFCKEIGLFTLGLDWRVADLDCSVVVVGVAGFFIVADSDFLKQKLIFPNEIIRFITL